MVDEDKEEVYSLCVYTVSDAFLIVRQCISLKGFVSCWPVSRRVVWLAVCKSQRLVPLVNLPYQVWF
uniref:Uncharacterized protein n=1 Tax=Anguilla anguilla TaxID=7936 RepID=A0A0E9TP95_ANGAN